MTVTMHETTALKRMISRIGDRTAPKNTPELPMKQLYEHKKELNVKVLVIKKAKTRKINYIILVAS